MDFFYYSDLGSILGNGIPINHITTATWVERYTTPGEFKLKAPVSSGLRDILFKGRVISHLDTLDLGIVEDHEIDEKDGEGEPELVITGRTYDSILEHFSVGQNIDWDGGTAGPLADYLMAWDYSYIQTQDLINAHVNYDDVVALHPLNDNDAILGVTAYFATDFPFTAIPATPRVIKRGNLHKEVLKLLGVDNFGIRVLRPTQDSPVPGITRFLVHNGTDKTAEVAFSYATGDLVNSRYFWSDRSMATHAHVVSKYNEIRVSPDGTMDPSVAPWDLYRRTIYVDAGDVDEKYSAYPTGTDRDDVLEIMLARGVDAINANREIALLSTDVSVSTKYHYRKDYDIGDVVHVEGNYGLSTNMRVTEFVEFQDENGDTGYPTLSVVS